MNFSNRCPMCEQTFKEWSDYHVHMTQYHGRMISSAITTVPLNTSGRSKAQIVDDAERSWLKCAILSDEHTAECRCMGCFTKYLDQVVLASDSLSDEAIYG
jgi:hypothetical protein